MANSRFSEANVTLIKHWLQECIANKNLFTKKSNHFTKIATLNQDSKNLLLNKKSFKPNETTRRQKGIWVELNEVSKKKAEHILYEGDYARFYLGNNQPVYRTRELEDSRLAFLQLVSKWVDNSQSLFDFFKEKIYLSHIKYAIPGKNECIYTGNLFLEGFGSATFEQWFGEANDATLSNFLVKDNCYVLPIDFEANCWSLSAPLNSRVFESNHKVIFIKSLFDYANNPQFWLTKLDAKLAIPEFEGDLPFLILPKLPTNFIGEMHSEDYESLPILKHQLPTNWDFNAFTERAYFEPLSKLPLFNNEKHFQAFFHLVTPVFPIFLASYHISNPHQRLDWEQGRFDKLKNICQTSTAFKEYLAKNYLSALKAILFRAYEFFADNKHYRPKTEASLQALWQELSNSIIKEAEILLPQLNLVLSETERSELVNFAKTIKNKSAQETVEKFYLEQDRKYLASQCKRELPSLPIANNGIFKPAAAPSTKPILESQSLAPSSTISV